MTKGNVLIVDDHELDRKLSTLDLEAAGYTVYEADGVDAALELMKQRTLDLIVLDVVMPGTDGLTFLRGLKTSDKLGAIPVVMLTASDDIDNELQAMAGGAIRYIVKPSHRDVLVQTVTEVLGDSKRSHPSSG